MDVNLICWVYALILAFYLQLVVIMVARPALDISYPILHSWNESLVILENTIEDYYAE